MHQIDNHDEIHAYYVINYGRRPVEYDLYVGKCEHDLIVFLAEGYELWPTWMDERPRNPRMTWTYYDGWGRIITPTIYRYDSWLYYLKNIHENEQYQGKTYKTYYPKSYNYKGVVFRQTPVHYTGRRRGGPPVRPRKLKHIVNMYGNPEYKEYNRGSRHDYPDGWWDDWYRHREKNWKSQTKKRHQWER